MTQKTNVNWSSFIVFLNFKTWCNSTLIDRCYIASYHTDVMMKSRMRFGRLYVVLLKKINVIKLSVPKMRHSLSNHTFPLYSFTYIANIFFKDGVMRLNALCSMLMCVTWPSLHSFETRYWTPWNTILLVPSLQLKQILSVLNCFFRNCELRSPLFVEFIRSPNPYHRSIANAVLSWLSKCLEGHSATSK